MVFFILVCLIASLGCITARKQAAFFNLPGEVNQTVNLTFPIELYRGNCEGKLCAQSSGRYDVNITGPMPKDGKTYYLQDYGGKNETFAIRSKDYPWKFVFQGDKYSYVDVLVDVGYPIPKADWGCWMLKCLRVGGENSSIMSIFGTLPTDNYNITITDAQGEEPVEVWFKWIPELAIFYMPAGEELRQILKMKKSYSKMLAATGISAYNEDSFNIHFLGPNVTTKTEFFFESFDMEDTFEVIFDVSRRRPHKG